MEKLMKIFAVFMVAAMILTACAQPQEVEEPVIEEPVVEEPVVEEPVVEEPVVEEPVDEEPVVEEPVVEEPEEFVFGMVLVGPYNDRGWSEAHYMGGRYVEDNIPGTRMIYIDKANPADRPGTTYVQLGEELVAQGAQLVIYASDDMKDDSHEFALNYPEITVMHISGDLAWEDGMNYRGLPNYASYMPAMEYMEMVGGCAAALETNNGKIGMVMPVDNDQIRRYVNAFYLGARYCWTEYLGNPAEELEMEVIWIGFWFHIPGFTTDPSLATDEFLARGFDVIVSGLDTVDPLIQVDQAAAAGADVRGQAYTNKLACDVAPDICLGVRFFNWGPEYVSLVNSILDGTFEPYWGRGEIDWDDINNPDTSAGGFLKGDGLSAENAALVDQFIDELGGGLNLWVGPLNWQDGSVFLADGEEASLVDIWYSGQLLENIVD